MDWISMLGALATMSSTGAQLVGVEICFKIVKKGSTGVTSPAPFLAFFVNACIWLKYAWMTDILSLVVTNVIGSILQFVYISVYYVYSTKKSHMNRILILSCFLLFGPLYYANYYEVEATRASRNLGIYGCISSVMCYASPLATLSEVLRKKSTESISLPLCIINFIAAVEWSVYGIAINNLFVTFPSVLGAMCGVMQFSLFFVYGCRKKTHRVINAYNI